MILLLVNIYDLVTKSLLHLRTFADYAGWQSILHSFAISCDGNLGFGEQSFSLPYNKPHQVTAFSLYATVRFGRGSFWFVRQPIFQSTTPTCSRIQDNDSRPLADIIYYLILCALRMLVFLCSNCLLLLIVGHVGNV